MPTSEPEINIALAGLLDQMRPRWNASGESLGSFVGNAKHPDILITEHGVAPMIIETEVMPASTVEDDARVRLGERLTGSGATINAVVAVRVPARIRQAANAALRGQLNDAEDLEYALLTGNDPDSFARFPTQGWLPGTVQDLARLVYEASIPDHVITDAAARLESGVIAAASLLARTATDHPGIAADIANALCQEDGEQTRRMAMTIVANAFVFHENLAGSHGIRSVDELRRESGVLSKTAVLDEWRKILRVNYWPIFSIARDIIAPLPQADAVAIVDQLARTAGSLIAAGLTRSHDLLGTVFQRLIADRKFLATFYTRPEAATLLASVALKASGSWADPKNVEQYVVADFACGTGTLLSAAYRRIIQLHEQAGGDSQALHARMMLKALVGCDVMPMSVHLTASMLASAHPATQFTGTRLYTLPYGKQAAGDYSLGSLDLLKENPMMQPLFRTSAPKRATGAGQEEATQALDVAAGQCDLVIMNPPFTRPTNHEGSHSNVPNPAFAAFGSDKAEQAAMAKEAKKLNGDSADGNAGVASYFIALANQMTGPTGTAAMILPLTVLQGDSWQKSRDLWQRGYRGSATSGPVFLCGHGHGRGHGYSPQARRASRRDAGSVRLPETQAAQRHRSVGDGSRHSRFRRSRWPAASGRWTLRRSANPSRAGGGGRGAGLSAGGRRAMAGGGHRRPSAGPNGIPADYRTALAPRPGPNQCY